MRVGVAFFSTLMSLMLSVSTTMLWVPMGATGEQVGVRFVNLHRNLSERSERDALACELTHIVKEGLPSEDGSS